MLKDLRELHRKHDLLELLFKAIIACSVTYVALMLLLALSIL
jgi:hypothetical protein